MKFEKQDARLGLLVLVALGLFLGLVAYKNAAAVTERTYPLLVRLDQMEGLAPGTDVQLKGYRVGAVERVDMKQEGKDYHFLARIAVRQDIQLWRGTRANLAPKGVGSVMLDLRLPDLAERTVPLAPGDEIPGDTGVSIAGVLERADHLMASLQAGVDGLRTRIEQKGLGDVLDHPALRRVLQSLDGTLREFQVLAKESRGLVGHADRSMGEADKALDSLDHSLASVRALLEKRGPELDQILVSLAATLKQAETFMGRFNTQDHPELEQSLKSLRRSLGSVEELLELLKQKPSRAVWGTPSEAEREKARQRVEAAKQNPPKP
ncbi:MAG TPA: MlaD family protein [Geothrix sp.]|nr:MlaD family protein [Geothrix sp.]